MIHVTDRAAFRHALATGVAIFKVLHALDPERFVLAEGRL